MPVSHCLDMLDPAFDTDGNGHAVNCVQIECRGQTYGFRILGDSGPLHAMQGFAPPVVSRNIQPRHGARLVN